MGATLFGLNILNTSSCTRPLMAHFLDGPNLREDHNRFVIQESTPDATRTDGLRIAQLLKEEVSMSVAKLYKGKNF